MHLVATGFQKSVGKFFLFMLGLLAQNITMSGVVYSIAAGVGVLSAGQILMNVIVVFCLVCSSTVTYLYICT